MLLGVRANDLDVDMRRARDGCDLLPLASCQIDGVAGICHHTIAKAQVIESEPVRQSVAFALHVERAQVAQSLLDGIDSKMHCAKVASQSL